MVGVGKPRRGRQPKVQSLRRPWRTAVATAVVTLVLVVLVLFVLMASVEVGQALEAGSITDIGFGRMVSVLGSIAILAVFAYRLVGPSPYVRRSRILPGPAARELDHIRQASFFGVGPLLSWTASNPSVDISQLTTPPPLEAVHHLFQLTAEGAQAESGLSTGTVRDAGVAVARQRSEAIPTGRILPAANHVVRRGDTYWSLAEAAYRDGTRWREIRDLNEGRIVEEGVQLDGDSDLRRGWHIHVPEALETQPTEGQQQ